MICVFEDVDASGHFIVGYVEGYCFDVPFVIYRVFGKDGDEVCLSDEFQQDVYFVQFYADMEIAI